MKKKMVEKTRMMGQTLRMVLEDLAQRNTKHSFELKNLTFEETTTSSIRVDYITS